MTINISGAPRLQVPRDTTIHNTAGSSITRQQPVMNSLSSVGNNPEITFRSQPSDPNNALDLVVTTLARENLPPDVVNAQVSADGEAIKNLVGIIYQDVMSKNIEADVNSLNTICSQLVDANGVEGKERLVTRTLAPLVCKYIGAAQEKLADKMVAQCKAAWMYHYDITSTSVADKDVFSPAMVACRATAHSAAEALKNPNLPWETLAQKSRNMVDDITAISKTMRPYHSPTIDVAQHSHQDLNAQPQSHNGITPSVSQRVEGAHITINNQPVPFTTDARESDLTASLKVILASNLDKDSKLDLSKDLFRAHYAATAHFKDNFAGIENAAPQRGDTLPERSAPLSGNMKDQASPETQSAETATPPVADDLVDGANGIQKESMQDSAVRREGTDLHQLHRTNDGILNAGVTSSEAPQAEMTSSVSQAESTPAQRQPEGVVTTGLSADSTKGSRHSIDDSVVRQGSEKRNISKSSGYTGRRWDPVKADHVHTSTRFLKNWNLSDSKKAEPQSVQGLPLGEETNPVGRDE